MHLTPNQLIVLLDIYVVGEFIRAGKRASCDDDLYELQKLGLVDINENITILGKYRIKDALG